ncbi:MAG: tRNA lysidine(34) synthetase TilS [Dehalococcoidia bacterium]
MAIAVSGGPDSLALLHTTARLRHRWGLKVVAVYVDHGIRPAAAIADECAFVAAEAGRCGVAFAATSSDSAGSGGRGWSPEDAARRGRYAALARIAAESGATAVATGHTRSDQAETVLLRVLRGSGLRGLAAMEASASWPVRSTIRPRLIRPLLGLTRAETEAYCAALGLTPRRDPENANARYLRNRVRSEVMPLLASLNHQIERVLADLANEARTWREYVEGDVPPFDVLCDDHGRRSVTVAVERVRQLEGPARLAALRAALEELLDGEHKPSRAHLQSLDRLVHGPRGRSVMLPAGIRAWREGGDLMLATAAPPDPPAIDGEQAVRVPGVTELPGWSIRAALVDDAATVSRTDWEQCVSAASIEGTTVGPRQLGDRIELAGMSGRRRLQDVFVDRGVPRVWRDRWPVLRAGDRVLWVPGLTRAAAWAATGKGRAVWLQVTRVDPPAI